MTVLEDMIPILVDLSSKKTTGIVNLTNPGTIEHNEILQMYKELVDPNFTWNNFTLEEQSQVLLSQRSNNELDATKLKQLAPQVKDIKTSVRELLLNWDKSYLKQ